MKLAAEFCLIGLAVHANDVSGDDNAGNQAVEGSAGELINHYITGIYNLEATKYAAYYMHELKIVFVRSTFDSRELKLKILIFKS